MKGHCDFFQSPKSFPYIPGGDLSGTVYEADDGSRFRKGDKVFVMFELPRPMNALAEYCVVKESLVELAPDSASFAEASCLTSSALSAWNASRRYVKAGSRVLILGGSGGVGTFLIQLAKNAGASYIAATSSDKDLVLSLGADRAVDYTSENWYEIDEFKNDPFDVIFDLGVGKRKAWNEAKRAKVLKNGWRGGKYCSFSGDEPEMKIHNLSQAISFMMKLQCRSAWTSVWRFVPKYTWHGQDGLDLRAGDLAELARMLDRSEIKVVLDPASSSKFTVEAIKRGFHVMDKRRAHGKVVIEVNGED
mmetsp:Transcript_19933/g.37518  ORF Transcript_19933/g.37518 Transcript_19933/m.37518 type:complete len:305 (-) Transcript_19933:80-994(-)